MIKRLLLVLSAALMLISCSASRYYSDYTREDITEDLAFLGPASAIVYMDKDNRRVFDDSLSLASEELICRLTQEIGVPVAERITLNDEQKGEAAAFLSHLKSKSAKERGNVPIPQSLDYLLESSGHRYGIVLFENGMVRDPKGIYKDMAVSATVAIIVAIISLGTIIMYSVPYTNISDVTLAVLDSQTDKIVFYNANSSEDTDPLNEKALSYQLKSLYAKILE